MKKILTALWISSRPAVIPSVFSNILLGWCLGGGAERCWFPEGLVFLGGFMFYLAGMWGNDVLDAEWDARCRAGRPIQRGLIGRRMLGVLSVLALAAGVACFRSWEAYTLAAAIVLYNLLHKKWASSVILMGVCRGMLVWSAAGAAGGEAHVLLYPAVIVLATYVAALTWWAREEDRFPERIPQVGRLLSLLPLGDALWLIVGGMYYPAILSAGLFCLARWLRRIGARAS